MTLTAGARLGPYEILSPLGAGGMGEVYRARDTTLNRHVAIKVLPESFADDPDRLARFEREAQTLALLNHPNIAHIHGLELSGGVRALVMELVEGEDLSQRIARLRASGASARQAGIPLDEALAIAKQIAEALEAAHEQGIIHRDLKPANIKVRPDGTVKVLDFGLAKAMAPVSGTDGASLTMSPTLSIHATQAGIILGTAAYMSPEQAAGRPVDTRSDLWSFGVVVLEMLTGQEVFTGETVSHVLAAVLKTEPDWSALPAETPASIRRLLRRCLEKDRKRRLANAADARLEIEDAAHEPKVDARREPASSARWRWTLPVVAGLAAIGVGGTAVWSVMRPASGPPPVVRLTMSGPPGVTVGATAPDPDVALSADSRRVVYVARTEGVQTQFYVRPLDQLEPIPLRGLPPSARSPFLSPDGEWVGFFDGTRALKKVAITGGPVHLICETNEGPRGASWGSKNVVIFATVGQDTGLMQVSADGGEARVLTKPDSDKGEVDHILPEILPGGDAVLFTVVTAEPIENSKIALLDLQTGQWRVLISGGSNPRYAASGHIVYGVGGTLRAVPFDLDRLEVRGAAVPVVERVVMKLTGAASFSFARDGAMVYLAGEPQIPERSLVWVDRQGSEEVIPAQPRGYMYARVSPDAERVALDIRDQGMHIYVWNVGGQTLTQLTDDRTSDQFPVWTRQGDRLAYTSTSPPMLFWRAFAGSEPAEPLVQSPSSFANSFAPDRSLVFTTARAKTGLDLYVLSAPVGPGPGTPSEPRPLLATSFQELNGEVSPDGRYLAYQSNESGTDAIHVRPFPSVENGHWKVSPDGATQPVWAPNGRELFYRAADGKLMAVAVQTQPTFVVGKTSVALHRAYFVLGPQGRSYDVSPDGKRFLMIKDAAAPTARATELVMVQNFFEELKRVAPSK